MKKHVFIPIFLSLLFGASIVTQAQEQEFELETGAGISVNNQHFTGEVTYTPSLHFVSHTDDTGIIVPGDPGIITPQSMSIQRVMTLTQNNVGIGTSRPTVKLHVQGTSFIDHGKLCVAGPSGSVADFPYGAVGTFQIGEKWAFNHVGSHAIGSNCYFSGSTSSPKYNLIRQGKGSSLTFDEDGNIHLRTMSNGTGHETKTTWQSLTLLNDGRVGIGTESPVEKMQIGEEWVFHDGGTKVIGRNWGYDGNAYRIKDGGVGLVSFPFGGGVSIETAGEGTAGSSVGTTHAMKFTNEGNLGIGTTTPQKKLHVSGDSYISGNVGIGTSNTSNYKLTVNGKINCTELIVTTNVSKGDEWPDYVFSDDYTLPSLNEVETFIQNNGHLPEVPSAAEVNEKGIHIGAMNTLLLKKVEELTLYILQQNEKMTGLQQQINELKKQ